MTNIISFTTVFLLSLFSVFLFNYNKGNRLSHKILAVFLLSNSIFIIDFLLPQIQQFLNIDIKFLNGVLFSSGFLFGPLLFIYTKSITEIKFNLNKNYLKHFVLFLIILIGYAIFDIINVSVVVFALHIQTLIYMFACVKEVAKYRIDIKNYYSSVEKYNLSWLVLILMAFILMWLTDLVSFSLIKLDNTFIEYQDYFTLISLSINFVFANLIVYRGLTHPHIFEGRDDHSITKKYEKSILRDDVKKDYLDILIKYIESEEPYLQAGLTLGEISDQLEIHPKYLSQVINEYLNKNFHDFINYYRIEEAKKQIKESIENKKTILEILYNCGFNTKSAFNNSFKKIEGVTPTQYRLSILN